jgi:hypothetical protein
MPLLGTDENGAVLDGGKSYKLTIDKNPPAKDFWSIVVYDSPDAICSCKPVSSFPARTTSATKIWSPMLMVPWILYFGPKAPVGKEANWIETVPGKGWFTAFRLYGPLQPWFDQTWKLNNIEVLD